MAVPMRNAEAGVGMDAIERAERMLGRPLPIDYAVFLQANDGGRPEVNVFDVPPNNSCGVNAFLSLASALETRVELGDRLADHHLPIAQAEGGNLVLVDLRTGSVVFWDHELESTNPIVPLARGFDAFWQGVRPLDRNTVPTGGVISTWISPSLRHLQRRK